MKKLLLTLAATVVALQSAGFAQSLQLDVFSPEGGRAHIFPTYQASTTLRSRNASRVATNAASNLAGVLTYHSGGIVIPTPTVYAIFWIPSTGKLQNGGATTLPAAYQTIETNLLKDYFGRGLALNNTQYYQIVGSTKTYITTAGTFGGSAIDTASYPASGCNDTATPGNCVSDAQIRAEIAKVMTAKGWTGGNNKIFFLFTSSGEGSCFNSSSCAYTQYCGYHSFFSSGGSNVIYGNEPYGGAKGCGGSPSPNSNPAADSAATVLSHELTEAITDPLLNAWFDSGGNEIGDLCNFYFGYQGYKSGTANEFWNNHYYLLQTEYSNYLGNFVISVNNVQGPAGCFNNGPEL